MRFSYLVGAGESGAAVCAAWRNQLDRAGVPVTDYSLRQYDDTVDPFELALELREMLERERNGVRFAYAGPEHVVLALERETLAAGAIPSEILAFATERSRIRVYCPHCRALGVHGAVAGDVVECGGCARRLSVRDHFSRRLAAFLGSDIDAGAIG